MKVVSLQSSDKRVGESYPEPSNNSSPQFQPRRSMTIFSHSFEVAMKGDSQMENLTSSMNDILNKSGIKSGTCTLFVKHTTASVMIIEDEPGIRADTQNFWNVTIPPKADWQHNTRNQGEDNGHSHLRGQLQGPSLTIPTSRTNRAIRFRRML